MYASTRAYLENPKYLFIYKVFGEERLSHMQEFYE